MADEPRRSGRSTKGQHTKNVDDPDASETPKPRGKGRTSKKAKLEDDEDEEEGEETIQCLCGVASDEEAGRNFVCCDNCDTWQHNDCMGLPAKYNPEQYFCWRCRPEEHPEVTESLANGDTTAEIAARFRARKGPKKGRQSMKAAGQADTQSPAPEPNKRKHPGGENGEQHAKIRKSSTPAHETAAPARGRRRKSAPTDAMKVADSINDLQPDARKKTAMALKTKFSGLTKPLTSKGTYKLPEEQTVDTLAERLAVLVEYSMFMNHCGDPPDFSGAYSAQVRTIHSNVGQNMTLFLGLLEGTITPDALSTMSSADMATEEQRKRDEKMKEEGEKQAMLIQEEGPRIRRTHKGEEIVEDNAGVASESITSTAPPRRMLSTQDEDDEPMPPASANPIRPPPIVTTPSEATPDPQHRRSSSNFNIQNVWSSVQSPTADLARPTHSSGRAETHQHQQRPDADIDRLLDDDGADSAPYSPTEASLDPHLVWRGTVDMPIQTSSIAQFPARAYHMAGSDLGGKEACTSIFPKDLVLEGRIAIDKADHYLTSLSAARSTDVSVFELIPASSDGPAADQFGRLFDYLKARARFGVVRQASYRPSVKDVYVLPLDAGAGGTPAFLARLAHSLLEDPRPRRMLLVVFVVRWKSPHGTPASAAGAALSPAGRAPGPAMSPTAAAAGPDAAGAYPLPGNPYALAQTPPAGGGAFAPVQLHNRQLAEAVLGPLAQAPVAQSIVGTAQTMLSAEHLQNLRSIFESYPEAQHDLQAVQRIIGGQSSAAR